MDWSSCVFVVQETKFKNVRIISKVDSLMKITGNVYGLCDGWAIEAQIFNFAQRFN